MILVEHCDILDNSTKTVKWEEITVICENFRKRSNAKAIMKIEANEDTWVINKLNFQGLQKRYNAKIIMKKETNKDRWVVNKWNFQVLLY